MRTGLSHADLIAAGAVASARAFDDPRIDQAGCGNHRGMVNWPALPECGCCKSLTRPSACTLTSAPNGRTMG